eukprot:TRINITY_DN30190_c0_g1_i1.p2 TRINITY_DN30190_c0_g1~~TRINITY_DN30190_c0_g1_i1.p2  ORF type:complete len:113 (+),score=34.54 TRINITY_DN30190_c0_g1_i1:25-363(+)
MADLTLDRDGGSAGAPEQAPSSCAADADLMARAADVRGELDAAAAEWAPGMASLKAAELGYVAANQQMCVLLQQCDLAMVGACNDRAFVQALTAMVRRKLDAYAAAHSEPSP